MGSRHTPCPAGAWQRHSLREYIQYTPAQLTDEVEKLHSGFI